MDSAPFRHRSYAAYMLRLWQAGSRSGLPVWRASLEDPHTGERLAFGDMQALFDFLAELMGNRETRVTAETAEQVDIVASDGSGEDVGHLVDDAEEGGSR